jgi:hypothetical protein
MSTGMEFISYLHKVGERKFNSVMLMPHSFLASVGVGDVGEKPDIVEGVGDALDGEEGEDALVALVFVKARCEGVL